jgi:hypothetical protein
VHRVDHIDHVDRRAAAPHVFYAHHGAVFAQALADRPDELLDGLLGVKTRGKRGRKNY